MRVAALTMIYNEPLWARVWVSHFARQVGAANCLVIDHGSTDGSTTGLGVAVERVQRSGALDEDRRAELVSDIAAALLRGYDAVVHTDADELLLADPARFADLREYAAAAPDVATAVGLELQHIPDEEPAFDPARPLGEQRQWVRFSGAMCKPALIRRPVRWHPGFHGADAPRATGPLYLVHLRYADLAAGLRRLARTRQLAFTRDDVNLHQKVADSEFEAMVRQVACLPRLQGELDPDGPLAGPWMRRMAEGWANDVNQLHLAGDALWRLPNRFRQAL